MNNILGAFLVGISLLALANSIYMLVFQYKTGEKVARLLIRDSEYIRNMLRNNIKTVTGEILVEFETEVVRVIHGKLTEKEQETILDSMDQSSTIKRGYLTRMLIQIYAVAGLDYSN